MGTTDITSSLSAYNISSSPKFLRVLLSFIICVTHAHKIPVTREWDAPTRICHVTWWCHGCSSSLKWLQESRLVDVQAEDTEAGNTSTRSHEDWLHRRASDKSPARPASTGNDHLLTFTVTNKMRESVTSVRRANLLCCTARLVP